MTNTNSTSNSTPNTDPITNQKHIDKYNKLQTLSSQLIKEMPEAMAGFGALHVAAVSEGALDTKTKELIALGIAITVRCDGCIAFHVHDALSAGANRQEIIECISVAIMMGGGPSMVYGCEALEALNQFEKQQDLPLTDPSS
ncbi:carboxymuconolactone decarboxylase family protein [Alteromonadaceae bacterium BrNp21-10]|nr:carboxymuconolactone decarboxylase family protein [Alteromonadaceae bacterium BrNp21-10]